MIDQPTGRGDDDVGALFERSNLSAHRRATKDRCDAHPRRRSIGFQRALHLQGELAGRHEDEAPRRARPRTGCAHEQAVDDRQAKGRRLAGARLGTHEQIDSAQDRGNRSGLYGRWVLIAQSRERRTERRREPEVRKRH